SAKPQFTHRFDRFLLWGRSMGAVSCVLYAATVSSEMAAAGINPMHPSMSQLSQRTPRIPYISGLILDSPFSSLWTLAESIIENYKTRLPKIVLAGVAAIGLPLVRTAILNKIHGFDIKFVHPSHPTIRLSHRSLRVCAERWTSSNPAVTAVRRPS